MATRITVLSGGVGGARLARGFDRVSGVDLSVIVNIGDDERFYGLYVSPDVDTVLYTLAGIEGMEGWGRRGDSQVVMEHLRALGEDTTFTIGDADLALNLYRTARLEAGMPLSEITTELARLLGVESAVLPVSDDEIRTRVQVEDGTWLSFQEYFVLRQHRDEVVDVRFRGARAARPGPGVIDAIRRAEAVVIAPSNPPLSVWPILSIPEVASAVAQAKRVLAVSPLFGGRALKGPADRVLRSLGFPLGNRAIVAAYEGLLDDLIIDTLDGHERPELTEAGVYVHVASTRVAAPEDAEAFAHWMLDLL